MQYIIVRYGVVNNTYEQSYIEYLFLDDTDSFQTLIKKFADVTELSIHRNVYANVYKFSIYTQSNAYTLSIADSILRNRFNYRNADILLHFLKVKLDYQLLTSIEFSVIPDEI